MNFTHAEAILRDVVAPVVTELERVGVTPGALMLVGAVCRDVLHLAAGHTSSLRRTGDLDLALAVDIIPFGDLEDSDGQVPTGTHDGPMNVLGFGDVWQAATTVDLPGGSCVRVPTIPGFAVLKLSAWASRSREGEYKDGADLACAMFWYQNLGTVHDRLYDEEREASVLERAGLDEPLAAVLLLIADALDCLTPLRRQDLQALWATTANHGNLLATYLENTRLVGWPRGARLLKYADAVRAAFVGT